MNLKTRTSIFRKCIRNSFAVVCVAAFVSCSAPDDPLLDVIDSQLSNVRIDNLTRTMNFVSSPVRFEKTQFEERLAAALNRWGKAESELMKPEQWKLDELAKQLNDQYSDLPVIAEFEGLGFLNTDSYNLQQNFWCKEIASRKSIDREMGPFEIYRVASEMGEVADMDDEDVDPLSLALQKIHDGMSVQDSEDLSYALKMFDFVVRNIYLLPEDAAAGDDTDAMRLNDADSLPAAGVPGLGYSRFPAQTLLFSRGDYVERAKLFMLLLNQLEIDSVMLETEINGTPKPWAVGVNIGGKLYMFDTKLGLPIPVGQSLQIATFSQLKSQPELLDELDLSVKESLKDETKYWVKGDQLKETKALVYFTPESTSYRYFELESKLIGETRMNLVVNPTKIIAGMPKIDGLTYGAWDIGFKTHQFRRAVRDAIAEASHNDRIRDKLRWYYNDEFYVNEFVRYRTARSKYFSGIYETIRNDGNLNAIELFFSMIYKDSKIQSLEYDPIFQTQLLLTQGQQSVSDFQNVIKGVQSNMRLVRRDSGYFLSHCHFDLGNFSTATNWLTRLEEIENTQRWQSAINYLRGRSLEAQRDYDSAIDVYNKQDSEQFHGDLVRVRLLKKITNATGEMEASTEAPKEEASTEAPKEEASAEAPKEDMPAEGPKEEEKVGDDN